MLHRSAELKNSQEEDIYLSTDPILQEREAALLVLYKNTIEAINDDDVQKLTTSLNKISNYGTDFKSLDYFFPTLVKLPAPKCYFKNAIKTLPLLFQMNIPISYTGEHAVLNHFNNIKEKCAKNKSSLGKAMLALLLQLQHKCIDQKALDQAEADRGKIIKTIVSDGQKDILREKIKDYVNSLAGKTATVDDEIKIKKMQLDFLDTEIFKSGTWINDVLTTRKGFGESQNLKVLKELYALLQKDLNDCLNKKELEIRVTRLEIQNLKAKKSSQTTMKMNAKDIHDDDLKNLIFLVDRAIKNDSDVDLKKAIEALNDDHQTNLQALQTKLNIPLEETVCTNSVKTLALLYQQGLPFHYPKARNNKGNVLAHFEMINQYVHRDSSNKIDELETRKIKGTAILILLLQLNDGKVDEESLKDAEKNANQIIGMIRTDENKKAFLTALKNWVDNIALQENETTDKTPLIDKIKLLEKKMMFLEGLYKKIWSNNFITNNLNSAYGDTSNAVNHLYLKLGMDLQKSLEECMRFSDYDDTLSQFLKDNHTAGYTLFTYFKALNNFKSADTNFDTGFKGKTILNLLLHLEARKNNPACKENSFERYKGMIIDTIRGQQMNKDELKFAIKEMMNSIVVKNDPIKQLEQRINFLKEDILKEGTWVYAALTHNEKSVNKRTHRYVTDLLQQLETDLSKLKVNQSQQAHEVSVEDFNDRCNQLEQRINFLEKRTHGDTKKINSLEERSYKIYIEDCIEKNDNDILNQFLKENDYTNESKVLHYFQIVDNFVLKNKYLYNAENLEIQVKGRAILNMLLHLENIKNNPAYIEFTDKTKKAIIDTIRNHQMNKDGLKLAIEDMVNNIVVENDTINQLEQRIKFLKENILKEGTWVYDALTHNGKSKNGKTHSYITNQLALLEVKLSYYKPSVSTAKFGLFENKKDQTMPIPDVFSYFDPTL